jgi:predicted kinase
VALRREARALHVEPQSLVVLGGLPGAGKSTLLRRLSARGPDEIRWLDSEQVAAVIRAHVPYVPYRAYRPVVHTAHHMRAVVAAFGRSPVVVVHETATRPAARAALAALARRSGRSAHLLLIDVDPADAVAGQARRGRRVSTSSMHRHLTRWRALRASVVDGPAGAPRPPEGYASALVVTRLEAARVDEVVIDASSHSAVGEPWCCAGRTAPQVAA